MWIIDLANLIRAQNFPNVGQNVFVFTMKENQSGIMLTSHSQGILAVPDIPDYYKGPLQMVARIPNDPLASLNVAQQVSDFLSSQTKRMAGQAIGITLPSAQINYLYPRHQPVPFPRTDGDFYECSVNFDVCVVAISG